MRSLVLLCLMPLGLFAQTGDPASVAGQVLNALTGEPIRKAVLTLRPAAGSRIGSSNHAVPTDGSGRFALTDLPPGTYRLTAERNGFVSMEYGARQPGRLGTALTLAAGQNMTEVVLRLSPEGVITGRVLDEDGDPVRNAGVQVMRYRYSGPRKQLMPAGGNSTNDLGEYRIFDLAPGKYFVSVNYRRDVIRGALPNADEEYVTTYYPGVKDVAAAAQVELAAGAQLHNIDFTLVKAHTVRVRGRVVGDAPQGLNRIQIVLMSGAGVSRGSGTDAKGEFDIPGVLPGSYTLIANERRAAKTWSARRALEVGNGNIDGLVVPLLPGATIAGRVRVEGQDSQPPPNLQLRLQPFEPASFTFGPYPNTKVNADGTFRVEDVSADRYSVFLSGQPEGYYMKSVRFASVDVLATGLDVSASTSDLLDIVLSPKAGQIAGVVQDSKQQPAASTVVVLIPDEKERRERSEYYRSVTSDSAGRFTMRNLLPGHYKVYAWQDVESGSWYDPDFMRPLESKGAAVTIEEGSRESVQLTAIE